MPGKDQSGVLLETPEKGVQVLSDVKPCSRVVQKKLVQARLPFKRLNPAPREKGEILQRKMPNVVQKASSVNTEYPLDDVENGCKMETGEEQPIPKTVNGWGPLDHFVRKMSKVCNVIPITIDLTEDSNSGLVEKLPSKGKVQSNLTNGPAFPSSDVVRSPSMAQTDKDLEDGDCLKQSASTHRFSAEEITEMSKKLPCSTEMQTIMPVDSASSFTCPDKDNAEDEDNPLSLNSSPVSSPDALANTQSPIKFASATGRCKEKEHQLNRPKLQAKEQRDHIREELKISKERAKEEAKKKKDEEREQKAKKKMEKKEKDDREKAEKIRLKEEKKKEKLEALEAKQEEKRKKEEEKRLKEEEKRMKAEKAEITRFLQKSKNSDTPKTFAESCGKFAPFEIKKNMAVAPLCRVEFEAEKSQLGKLLKEQNSKANFLLELRTRKPRRMGRTVIPKVPLVSETDDVQVVIETDRTVHENITRECVVPERRMFGKMKLLQFCENYRPAYWGTWYRSSKVICPRRPWAQDTMLLDYEVDSDEEWEEDEPGESLSHSEGDDDEDPKEEEDDEDDDDDGFFVPHGYLSDDEGGVSDEECKNPENQKLRQRLKAKEWDELQSKGKKINVLKPILIGCVWLGGSKGEIAFLQKFSACVLDSLIPIEDEMVQECTSRKLEDRAILMNLLPLLHGNVNGSKIIIQEFQECCKRGIICLGDSNITVKESESPNACQQIPSSNIPSKARLKRIISENSVYEKRPDHRLCWYVYDDILKSFQQESLPVPCQWTYVTQLNPPNRDEVMTAGAQMQTTPSGKRKSAGSMPITKFMKKATVLGSFTNIAVTEADGFQADTEEDDDDDDVDCMIVEEQLKRDTDVPMLCMME